MTHIYSAVTVSIPRYDLFKFLTLFKIIVEHVENKLVLFCFIH